MEITTEEARVILEMIGNIENYAGNTGEEEELDSKIRNNFSEHQDYDYLEEKEKYGW